MKKRLQKYLKILGKGGLGIGLELIYPIIVSTFALLLCSLIYFLAFWKK